jgi:PAS domain S-box-containing protein
MGERKDVEKDTHGTSGVQKDGPVGSVEPDEGERRIEVSGIKVRWKPSEGTCDFEGLPVAMMWVDTTLAGVMAGVQAMVGTERFGLALQNEGRKSVEADWSVISQFEKFEDGFAAIAGIAAVAGWGRWALVSLDRNARTCRFRVSDSWEGRYQRTLGVCWGSGMLAGKLAGYCSKLFEVNCWAEQVRFIARGDATDNFIVAPSPRSIEEEVDRLLITDRATRADMAVALQKLRDEVLRRTTAEEEVRRAQHTLERKVEERTAALRVANERLHREVAERRATEEALRASEERYRKVVANAPVAFVVWDLDCRVIEWNERAETMFGWARQEVIGANFFDMIIPDSAHQSVSDMVRALRAGQGPQRSVNENVTKDGRILVCEWSNSILHDGEGRGVCVMSIALDISERRQAEADRVQRVRFLENLAKLDRAIKEAGDMGGMLGDALQVAMEVLNADRAWLLYPADPLAPSWSVPMERCRPEYPGAMAMGVEIPMSPEAEHVMEDCLGADGPVAYDPHSRRPVPPDSAAQFGIMSMVTLALRPRLGKPWVFGMHQCSHARVWSEEDCRLLHEMGRRIADSLSSFLFLRDLRASERNYRELVEGTSDLIVRLDAHGRILFVNHLARKVFGLEPAACVGLSSFEFVHDTDRQRTRAALKDWCEHRLPSATVENSQVSRSGAVTEMLWTFKLHFDEKNRVVSVDGIARDIGEVKRAEVERLELERQVLHAQKLDSLGVLAGGIAHDFNNILMGVLGNAELARFGLPPGSPAHASLERVETAALRAADLAKQMLAYSGKGHFAIERIRLNDIVNEMTHLLGTVISKKARLQVSLADDVPAIEGDVTQLRQIVMNLLTNASEAIGQDSGTITLSTRRVEATEEERAMARSEGVELRHYALLSVADDGCGMDLQTRERIFDPFFTTKFTGRGLGLAAVLGICRGHKAKIDIDSEPGRGATFRLFFPSSGDASSLRPDAEPTIGDRRGSGTILVVDDEEIVLEVALEALAESGFDVVVARDGQEAVDTFRQHSGRFDAVILDMTMPRMSGEEAFQEMRLIRPDVRVILCSGYDELDTSGRFGGKGVSSFIQKPYRPTELIDTLQSLLAIE